MPALPFPFLEVYMKFFAEPNLYVRFTQRHRRIFGMRGFSFDENGEYETDKELLIRLLKQRFKYEEPQPEPETTAEPSETIRHCKKCDFTCTSQGELMRHYREFHPKQ